MLRDIHIGIFSFILLHVESDLRKVVDVDDEVFDRSEVFEYALHFSLNVQVAVKRGCHK
jgi:hypothetical protein